MTNKDQSQKDDATSTQSTDSRQTIPKQYEDPQQRYMKIKESLAIRTFWTMIITGSTIAIFSVIFSWWVVVKVLEQDRFFTQKAVVIIVIMIGLYGIFGTILNLLARRD